MACCILAQVSLLVLSAHCTLAGIHSHYFFMTAVNDLTSDVSSYVMTRTLDDIILLRYDSDHEVVERRVPWYKSPYATLLDASITFFMNQLDMQSLLRNISSYTNDPEGYHVLQRLEGCTLYDNGTVQGSFGYRFDGKPFMYFDLESETWTAETLVAEELAKMFNSNLTLLKQNPYLLVNTCIPHIRKLLSMGNCTFNRKEAPVVKVRQIPTDSGGVRLYCRAYGHYPKDISIMWYKNGQPISEEMMERLTLPLLDMTYLTSLSFIVTSAAYDVYTCKVNHESMPENFNQEFRISDDFETLSSVGSHLSTGAVIGICLAVILVIVITAFGSIAFVNGRRQPHLQFS
ncbi:major histocompatibility complex class I-related protein 1-like [Leptodactylus fuscus]|uniref:major histocompatibility complex class I-related protein 1-like n=1 Tax=Leptodactylus fuscus TaxID=238119 RepID=UPI003F4F07A7